LYIAGALLVGITAVLLRKLPALALAAASSIAILAAGWSILLVYGPLYPYLVIWTGALVIPAWIAAWLVVAPSAPAGASVPRAPASADASRVPASPRPKRLAVPTAGVVMAAAVCAGFAVSQTPLTDGSAHFARSSWDDVAGAALSPRVKTVYVDIANQEAMPEAAAIADQAIRHHRRVEVNRAALFFLDPSFAPRWAAQLKVVVCCGRGDPGPPTSGLAFRGLVGGQRIFILAGGPSRQHRRSSKPPVPSYGRMPNYLFDKDNDNDGRHPL
jgi:hypothetical protein